ncbi:hypothetical protein [Salinicola acroporae]|uniref:hypothetical protein n=1 Tax=Salinicola acroporae TaxID=1541440 RepID=UPI0024569AE8|nr:hypothetical protein [Salinicola acroporae]
MLQLLFSCLGCLTLLVTLAPYMRIRHWSVRSFDFPLLQIAIAATALALIQLAFEPERWWHWAGVAASVIAAVIQWARIYPWTPLARCTVVKSNSQAPEHELKLLVSNVLTPNRQASKLIDLVQEHDPDILLTLESDQWWGINWMPPSASRCRKRCASPSTISTACISTPVCRWKMSRSNG